MVADLDQYACQCLLFVSSLQVNYLVTKQFATKFQFHSLSHNVCLPFSTWKVYNKNLLLHIFISKNMGHMGWTN
jgi:hypothetical protein